MSEEEGGFGLSVSEKLFGLIILVVGILFLYITYTNMDVLGGVYSWFFGILCFILMFLGLVMLTSKPE